MQKVSDLYYAIDGDDVGRYLECLLLQNNPEEAGIFSQKITEKITVMSSYFIGQGAKVIFCTGDGLLAFSKHLINVSHLIGENNDVSFSIGIGDSSANALLALKKAKGLGKARIETLFGQ